MRLLLVIDPQNDFMDTPGRPGSLAVPGAHADMLRLGRHIETEAPDAVVLTQDSHTFADIGHPAWWQNAAGEAPKPFTLITAEDVANGTWKAADKSERAYSAEYVRKLGASMVWPVHCLLGERGWRVNPELINSIHQAGVAEVHTFLKGLNPRTEHYSAIQADIPDPADARTGVNTALLETLERFDRIEVAGEALSHCVNRTVRDIVALRPHLAERIVLLTDAMSSVPGFEQEGQTFLTDMVAVGCGTAVCRSPPRPRP